MAQDKTVAEKPEKAEKAYTKIKEKYPNINPVELFHFIEETKVWLTQNLKTATFEQADLIHELLEDLNI